MRRVFRLPSTGWRLAREVDDELAFHLETRVRRLMADGMPEDAARREAIRQFGDLRAVRESCVWMDQQRERSRRRANMLSDLIQDLSFAFRTLRSNAAFTILIIGALAVGIGANTAIFTMIDAVLVRGLPVPRPEQLVTVGDPTHVSSHSTGTPRTDLLSVPLYRDVQRSNHVFSDVLASGRSGRLDVRVERGDAEFEHPHGRFVSGNYFDVLGVHAMAGRTFDASADSVTGGAAPVTISYGYWIRRFHADPSAVGHAMIIDGAEFVIVGVTPPSFAGEIVEQSPDLWLPLGMHDVIQPHARVLDDRLTSWLLLIGRLKPGVGFAQAKHEIGPLINRDIVANAPAGIASAFSQSHPKEFVEPGAKGFSAVRSAFEAPLVTLMIGVGLLLCIICANVANLLLSRAIARGREMAVRLAMGASRARLVRQLLTEAGVLAIASAGSGLLIAQLGGRWLVDLAAGRTTLAASVGLNGTILGFTLGVSLVAVGIFGLAPALYASRVDLATVMRASAHAITGAGGRGAGRRPIAKLLIIGQVALSVVLLTGAAILSRSLRNVQDVDVGFDRDHMVVADLDIQTPGYLGTPLANEVHTLRDRLAAVPGVRSVAYSENGLFSGTDSHTTIELPGFIPRTPDDTSVAYDNVSPHYASAIGARLIAGRDLLESDENRPARTAIVNQSLAAFYFPHESAVGKYLRLMDSISVQIVGVIADTRDHNVSGTVDRRMYFPYVHTDTSVNQLGTVGSLRMEIRTSGNPAALVQQIRKTIVSVDPALPVDGVDTMAKLMSGYITQERLMARLATAFGLLALALAAIGLYGVMSYSVARRTNEMGLRVALGAQAADVLRLVLADALALVAIGLLLGVPLALALLRLIGAQLHGVGAADPLSIAVALSVLVASAVFAVLIPARRAARVPPVVALRES